MKEPLWIRVYDWLSAVVAVLTVAAMMTGSVVLLLKDRPTKVAPPSSVSTCDDEMGCCRCERGCDCHHRPHAKPYEGH